MADRPPGVLQVEGVRLGLTATDKWDAVRQAGAVLVELSAVETDYGPAMLERETSVSTFVGAGVAIPHGTDAARALVRRTTLAVLQFPAGIDWDGNEVTTCVAIAARGEEHVDVLSALAVLLLDESSAARLHRATDPEDVLALLGDLTPDREESTA